MLRFNHSGNFGDIIYALPFCLALLKHKKLTKANFNLQINVKANYFKDVNHPYDLVRMNIATAKMLQPLLESQVWINKVSISEDVPKKSVELDIARKLGQNFSAGSISQWYYPIVPEILNPYPLEQAWLIPTETKERFKDKIVVIRSNRYRRQGVNFSSLKPLKDKLIFLGLSEEYAEFRHSIGDVEFIQIEDFLEALNIINSSKLVVGNQTGLFSLAEAINKDRCLETAFECPNVVMSGGRYFPIISEAQLEITLREYFK